MSFALRASLLNPESEQRRTVLLAPEDSVVPYSFTQANSDPDSYERLLSDMQRFRGNTYLRDGAIRERHLDSGGRHRLDVDRHSWHVLSLDGRGQVCGCSRYSVWNRNVSFDKLAVGKSALAYSDSWGGKLRQAVERERARAEHEQVDFAEVGGWALSERLRRSTEAIRIALTTYALAQLVGGGIVLTTATVRHSSAAILRKIGGAGLLADETEFPRYFDPQYDCEMEILRFDSASVNPKFLPWIRQIGSEILTAPVLTARPGIRPLPLFGRAPSREHRLAAGFNSLRWPIPVPAT